MKEAALIIRTHGEVRTHELPGLQHWTLAGHEQGVSGMEVWAQVVQPGGGTPMHRHECSEVIMLLQGTGRCECDGRTHEIAAPSTLIVPPGAVHQIVNTGTTEMRLIAALTMSPVRVETPDRQPIPLPWG